MLIFTDIEASDQKSLETTDLYSRLSVQLPSALYIMKRRADHSSRGVLPCVYWVWSRNLNTEEDMAQVWAAVQYDIYNELGSSASTVSGYGLDDRATEVWSPSEARGIFL
jgi:hypothetical protein